MLCKCHYSINNPENKNIYQKLYIFICTTKLIKNSEYNNYNITCGRLTYRTRGYGDEWSVFSNPTLAPTTIPN